MDDPGIDYGMPTDTTDQERIDAEHLNALTLCHYIGGGIIALFSCMFIFHVVMGVLMVHNPGAFAQTRPVP